MHACTRTHTVSMDAETYTIRQPGCTAWIENVDSETAIIEYETAISSGLDVMIIEDSTLESVSVEEVSA